MQPPDPIEEWDSDPFKMEIRNNRIYARGAQDDKGQVFFFLKAIEYLISRSQLGINIKLCLEGEEEIGSPNLVKIADSLGDRLKADLLLVCDTDKTGGGNPCIVLGLRGICGFEFQVKTADRMLHSGMYGGSVANAASVAARLIASLHDEDGRIAVPGIYDDVLSISQKSKEILADAAESDDEVVKAIGAKKLWGEPEFSRAERVALRPSIDINGITAGYQGEGSKTVIPNTATFKLTSRLVANQLPEKISSLLLKHFQNVCPETAEVILLHSEQSSAALSISAEQREIIHVKKVLQKISEKEPKFDWVGGSIPIVAEIVKNAGAVPLLVGFGTDEGRIHEPNESFGIQDFWEGFRFVVAYITDLK